MRRDAEAELPAIVGRGVKPSGALGDYLPEALVVQGIAADAYHGGRNEGSVELAADIEALKAQLADMVGTQRPPSPIRRARCRPAVRAQKLTAISSVPGDLGQAHRPGPPATDVYETYPGVNPRSSPVERASYIRVTS